MATTVERSNITAQDLERAIKSKDNRWAILAALRFVLALIVMFPHTGSFANLPKPLHYIDSFSPITAVLVFLVISGYSIAHSINTERSGFYSRRLGRIYPLYFVCMVLTLIPFMVWGPSITFEKWPALSMPNIKEVIGNFALLEGFVVRKISAPTWSLTVEVLFYALAPILVLLRTRWLLLFVGISAIMFADAPTLYFIHKPMHGNAALMTGWAWVLGFLYYRHKDQPWAKNLLLVVGAIVIIQNRPEGRLAELTWLCATLLIIHAPEIRNLPARVSRTFVYLGELSYPLYILHFPVLVLLGANKAHHPWWVYVVTVFIVTIAAYHLIDAPYRKSVKRRASINWRAQAA